MGLNLELSKRQTRYINMRLAELRRLGADPLFIRQEEELLRSTMRIVNLLSQVAGLK